MKENKNPRFGGGKRRNTTTAYLTRAAAVAAIYVVLTLLSMFLGLDKGAIQLRFSEALCVLPMLMPSAVPGLFVGCLISNIITGCAVWDIIFGSLATLIGAFGAYLLRNLPEKIKLLGTIPNILSNSLIVPLILMYAYGVEGTYFVLMGPILLSEIICSGVFGTVLYYTVRELIKKYRI